MESRSWKLSAALTVILVFSFVYWIAGTLKSPGFCLMDEFLTFARSKNFLATGDLAVVTIEGRPSWEKPPLQYWFGALMLSLGLEPTVALRVFPLIFSLLTVGLTVFAALYLSNFKNPWVMLYSVLFLGLSQHFVQQSRSAMLETGFCFFVGLSVVSLWKAQENTKWWYIWGLSCGLAALQKVPLAWVTTLLVALPYLFRHRESFWGSLKDGRFVRGLFLGVFLTLLWPGIQVLRWGTDYWYRAGSETVFRVTHGIDSLEGSGMGLYFERLLFFTADSSVFWLLAVVVFTVIWKRESFRSLTEDPRAVGIALFLAVLALGLVVSAGPVYPRYQLVVVPLVIALTAASLPRFSNSPLFCLLLLTLCWSYQGERIAAVPYREVEVVPMEMGVLASRFGEVLERSETGLIFLDRSDSPIQPYLPHDQKVRRILSLDDLQGPEPITLFTQVAHLQAVESKSDSVKVLSRGREFVILRVVALGQKEALRDGSG